MIPQSDMQPATARESSEALLSLRPRLTITFGDILTVTYSYLTDSGPSASCSLEEGDDTALKTALEELQLDIREINPTVECWLPLRDVRLSRGMAGSLATNGLFDSKQIVECTDKARAATADVSPGWAGTRIWGDVAEIVVDDTPLKTALLEQSISGNKLRVEVLEAFYIPDAETARTALLHACGLNRPISCHLQIVGYVEAFTTKREQYEGIAMVCIGRDGAEIAVAVGGHIVALGLIAAIGDDPTHLLFGFDTWLASNGWSLAGLPHGVRLLGSGLTRDWLGSHLARLSMPVSLMDDPAISISLLDELIRQHKALVVSRAATN